MKIDETKCMNCCICIPYCPMNAIKTNENGVYIDSEDCVECGVCLRSGACKFEGIYQDELSYPRTLRAHFSNPQALHPETGIGGRGTQEVKTNDITDRYKLGEVGFAIEMGRPILGSSFEDFEIATIELAKHSVEFEPNNPTTNLIDTRTGKLKDSNIRGEKFISCIIEFKVPQERFPEVIQSVREIAKKIGTVFSFDIITRCDHGKIPIESLLKNYQVPTYLNAKMNLGLGRIRSEVRAS